jgi:hypothetical protein
MRNSLRIYIDMQLDLRIMILAVRLQNQSSAKSGTDSCSLLRRNAWLTGVDMIYQMNALDRMIGYCSSNQCCLPQFISHAKSQGY